MSYPNMVMRMLAFAVALFAVTASAAEISADENLVSERLSSRAMGVLDGMFGPGRAKVLVEVRGERLQIHTETEVVTPLAKPAPSSAGVKEAMRLFDLPGYYKDREAKAAAAAKEESDATHAVQPFQKDLETSLRDAGFEIKKIEATAILDSTLTEAEARDAAQLLPQLLRIDGTRGDVLTIVRAPMRPAWKTAFSTPGDWRKLAFAASGLLCSLIIVMIISGAFVRGARVFAKELTARGLGAPAGGDGAELGDPLPELMPGSPAGLIDVNENEDAAGPFPALGRRFDFLETADAAGAASILADQPPADLAQIFAYLAKVAPETASRMFSKLPADIQAEASISLLKLKTGDPERLSEIEERLKTSISNGLRGSERLAAILSRFPGEERAMLLGRLATREDSRNVEEVERLLFSFEDFVTLSAADLRRVMSAVPYELWGTALRGAPESLINSILSELPDGPRNLVREESSIPHPKDKVVAARSKILDCFLDLAAKGQITLDRGAGAEETL